MSQYARFIVADVFDGLVSLPDDSVDLIVTSPPFLALRSYLPADSPLKAKEIGSEATPGEFIDVLLDVVEACERVLAPHGTLVFELGDTYSGSGGDNHLYDSGYSGHNTYPVVKHPRGAGLRQRQGWPLDKSLAMIPESFRWALAYGRNPFNGRETPRWRVRNVHPWVRPNPPVGALGDKWRPATSYLVSACKSRDRYFDLDAVRVPSKTGDRVMWQTANDAERGSLSEDRDDGNGGRFRANNPAGAPPLDWIMVPTEPYSGVLLGDTLYRASPDCPEHSLRAIRQRLQTGSGGELREALLRNSRRTDLRPAVKQVCALHAKSDLDNPDVRLAMMDWLDQSIQSERMPENTRVSKTPALRHSSGQGVETLASDAKTATRTSSTPTASTMTDQTLVLWPLEHADAANPRDTGSSRTDLAPATSAPGTPSVQSPGHTDGSAASPESSDERPDTPLSSTSEAYPPADEPETGGRTARRSSPRCSCTQYTDSTSHYATWPRRLVLPFVESMCPRRVCLTCGQPSRRVTEGSYLDSKGRPHERQQWVSGVDSGQGAHSLKPDGGIVRQVSTIGWTDCGHNQWRAGVTLDPFAGSGATIDAAFTSGRSAIGIDIDGRNADLARQRCGMWLEVEELIYPSEEAPA